MLTTLGDCPAETTCHSRSGGAASERMMSAVNGSRKQEVMPPPIVAKGFPGWPAAACFSPNSFQRLKFPASEGSKNGLNPAGWEH